MNTDQQINCELAINWQVFARVRLQLNFAFMMALSSLVIDVNVKLGRA